MPFFVTGDIRFYVVARSFGVIVDSILVLLFTSTAWGFTSYSCCLSCTLLSLNLFVFFPSLSRPRGPPFFRLAGVVPLTRAYYKALSLAPVI